MDPAQHPAREDASLTMLSFFRLRKKEALGQEKPAAIQCSTDLFASKKVEAQLFQLTAKKPGTSKRWWQALAKPKKTPHLVTQIEGSWQSRCG